MNLFGIKKKKQKKKKTEKKIINNFDNGSLKDVNIPPKITIL